MIRVASILACLILPASVALAQEAAPSSFTARTPLSVPGNSQVQGREGIPDRMEPMPEEMQGVVVEEHFDAKLPMDATFKGEDGRTVTLGEMFKSGKPVVLQLGYMSCPKLCDIISEKTADGLAEVPLQMGRDYTCLFISIDPNEKPELAAGKKQNYIRRYVDGNKHDAVPAVDGWHFLTGDKDNIDRVAQAIGYKYKFVQSTQQYSHPSVIMVLTPNGQVASYLYGAAFEPALLKVAIVKAADGKTGSLMDRIIMTCVHFDPNTGKYSIAAMRVMRFGGAVTVFCVLSMMGLLSLKGRKMRGIASDKPKTGLAAVLSSQPNTKS